nr:helix-turn-helix transcriptional regulator [Hyella patelloides]
MAAHTEQLKSETALNEIRHAVSLTQDELASKLNVKQPAISRLEKRSDMGVVQNGVTL